MPRPRSFQTRLSEFDSGYDGTKQGKEMFLIEEWTTRPGLDRTLWHCYVARVDSAIADFQCAVVRADQAQIEDDREPQGLNQPVFSEQLLRSDARVMPIVSLGKGCSVLTLDCLLQSSVPRQFQYFQLIQ